MIPESEVFITSDVNRDGRIGLAEALYVLQVVSGLSQVQISGDFLVTDFNPYSTSPAASLSLLTFHDDGTGIWGVLIDPVRGEQEDFNFSYIVASDGSFTITVDGEQSRLGDGVVSSDGKIITWAQTYDDAGINIGIKKSK